MKVIIKVLGPLQLLKLRLPAMQGTLSRARIACMAIVSESVTAGFIGFKGVWCLSPETHQCF